MRPAPVRLLLIAERLLALGLRRCLPKHATEQLLCPAAMPKAFPTEDYKAASRWPELPLWWGPLGDACPYSLRAARNLQATAVATNRVPRTRAL
ncbi:hypothetical protein GUJ93_ZPchr0008g13469 [Zizania palustris]|uniref:Secreted protein n=1 Tax=Zizania palustris TaxID=103762 RepID=A0A8J5R719_ZIZPA|nr:hypothetical protein GUJ93_ZPchr0008g13469 [Zizania palustris]